MLVPNTVLPIRTSLDNFFKYWLEFLRPIHKLSDRQMDVVAAFLRKRYELSKSIVNNQVLDKVLMGEGTKLEIRESLGMSYNQFQNLYRLLVDKGIIVNNSIHPKLIPKLSTTEEPIDYKLMLAFDIKDGLQRSV